MSNLLLFELLVQSAYFHATTVSLHTGYVYSGSGDFGFVSLSDSNNHKAEVLNALYLMYFNDYTVHITGCSRRAPASV